MALPHDDPSVDDPGDGVVADALMPDLHLLPGIWKIDGYGRVAEAIKANFAVTEGKNFFQYPYVSARKLAKAAHGWLTAWRESSGNAAAKLILVGHSMGGLVSRYFLECMEGWKVTKALVTFGTPYRGSLNALDGLANGLKKGPLELSKLARQLTALYQLLPVFECYDAGDGKLVRVGETAGIPHVDPAKAGAAGFRHSHRTQRQAHERHVRGDPARVAAERRPRDHAPQRRPLGHGPRPRRVQEAQSAGGAGSGGRLPRWRARGGARPSE